MKMVRRMNAVAAVLLLWAFSLQAQQLIPNTTADPANHLISGTVTADELISHAARWRVQADLWHKDGTEAKILNFAKLHRADFLAAPSAGAVANLHSILKAGGYTGDETQLAGWFNQMSASDRATAYNLLVTTGVKSVMYSAALMVEHMGHNYSFSAKARSPRLLQVILPACGSDDFRAIQNTIGLLGVLYGGAGALGCIPCVGAAFSFGVTYAIIRLECGA